MRTRIQRSTCVGGGCGRRWVSGQGKSSTVLPRQDMGKAHACTPVPVCAVRPERRLGLLFILVPCRQPRLRRAVQRGAGRSGFVASVAHMVVEVGGALLPERVAVLYCAVFLLHRTSFCRHRS